MEERGGGKGEKAREEEPEDKAPRPKSQLGSILPPLGFARAWRMWAVVQNLDLFLKVKLAMDWAAAA